MKVKLRKQEFSSLKKMRKGKGNFYEVLEEEDISNPSTNPQDPMYSLPQLLESQEIHASEKVTDMEIMNSQNMEAIRTQDVPNQVMTHEPGTSTGSLQQTSSALEQFKPVKYICPSNMTKEEKVELVTNMQRTHGHLKAKLCFGLSGQPIITAFNKEAATALQKGILFRDRTIMLQTPSLDAKVTKLILLKYRAERPLQPILDMKEVVSADRLVKYAEKIPQNQVIIKWKGPYPPKISIPFQGEFPLELYQEGPLQCKRCYKYKHSTDSCRNQARCGVCAGYHKSQECLDKIHKEKREIRLTCVNCLGNHYAWTWSCSARPESSLEKQRRIQKDQTLQATVVPISYLPATPPAVSAWSNPRHSQPIENFPALAAKIISNEHQGSARLVINNQPQSYQEIRQSKTLEEQERKELRVEQQKLKAALEEMKKEREALLQEIKEEREEFRNYMKQLTPPSEILAQEIKNSAIKTQEILQEMRDSTRELMHCMTALVQTVTMTLAAIKPQPESTTAPVVQENTSHINTPQQLSRTTYQAQTHSMQQNPHPHSHSMQTGQNIQNSFNPQHMLYAEQPILTESNTEGEKYNKYSTVEYPRHQW